MRWCLVTLSRADGVGEASGRGGTLREAVGIGVLCIVGIRVCMKASVYDRHDFVGVHRVTVKVVRSVW